jgi:Zn-finger protein
MGRPHSARYFRNPDCAHFPCHPGADPEDFNCLMCYCPLYMLPDCGGDGVWRGGIKDCTPCLVPHRPGGYEQVLERLRAWFAAQRERP